MRIIEGGKSRIVPEVKARKQTKRKFTMDPSAGEESYQASEFLIPSHDAQGHASKIIAMVTHDTKREIQRIIASGVIPVWGTEGDLLRWCVYKGLEILNRDHLKDPALRDAHTTMNNWMSQESKAMEMDSMKLQLSTLKKRIKGYVADGHYIPAREIVLRVEENLSGMNNDYWRAIFQREIVDSNSWLTAKAKAQAREMKKEMEQ